MTDDIGTFSLQHSLQLAIANIEMVETRARINCFARPMDQAIYHKNIMSSIQIGTCQVRTNKTRTTNHSYFHSSSSPRIHFVLLLVQQSASPYRGERPALPNAKSTAALPPALEILATS